MSKLQCPVCGSYELSRSEETRRYTPPFGEPVEYRVPFNTCQVCGEEGDFACEGDAIVQREIDAADKASAERDAWSLVIVRCHLSLLRAFSGPSAPNYREVEAWGHLGWCIGARSASAPVPVAS